MNRRAKPKPDPERDALVVRRYYGWIAGQQRPINTSGLHDCIRLSWFFGADGDATKAKVHQLARMFANSFVAELMRAETAA